MIQQTVNYILCTILVFLFALPATAANLNIETYNPAISRLFGDVKILRDYKFIPATYGMMLKKGDEVQTGRRGRVYIDFPDNSRVKLGSRAHFLISDWGKNNGIFTSALHIFRGAFRYTAGAIRGFTSRKTTVSTRTAVLGVRGTDFWGRVGEDKTFLLLIEGEISLAPINGKAIIYNKALHAVNIDSQNISKPEKLSMNTISPLAAETEIEP